jgi:hypothetical protein
MNWPPKNGNPTMKSYQSNPPRVITIPGLAPEEMGVANGLYHLAFMLDYHVSFFQYAVELYLFSVQAMDDTSARLEKDPSDVHAEKLRYLVHGWPPTAGRSGAIALFDFDKTLIGLIHDSQKLPLFVKEGRAAAVANARDTLQAAFPNISGIRNAASHIGDRTSKPSWSEKHAKSGDYKMGNMLVRGGEFDSKGIFVDHLHDGVYTNSWDGELVSYRLDEGSVAKLAAVRDEVFKALA